MCGPAFPKCLKAQTWKKLIYFNWRLITLQYCSSFFHTLTWVSHGCTCVPHPELPLLPPSPSHPSGLSQCTSFECPVSCIELGLVIYFTMVIYMFQCYSLKSSHPRLLPQSPKVCSLHLCLLCYLTYRVIITIFLNSIYMHQYTVLVFFFLTYFILYNRL